MLYRTLAISVLVLACAAGAMAQPPEPPPNGPHSEPMPDLVWPPEIPELEQRWPYFVGIDRVLLPDGTLDTEVIHPNTAFFIQRQFLDSAPETPCREVFIPGEPHMSEPHWQDYLDIVDEMDFVVVARVTGTTTGFVAERAGTLLRLQPFQWLKGQGTWETKFVFFSSANISLGGKPFCVTHSLYPVTPTINDRVLIAYRDNFLNRDYPWLGAYPAAILVLKANGQSHLPHWTRERRPDWIGQPAQRILGEIRQHLNRPQGPQP